MNDFSTNRRAMVDSQLRTSGVMAPAVIAAMSTLARENFVPALLHSTAYMDRGIPLCAGRMLNPPLATGLMLQEAAVRANDRILIIGAGTGYMAALLAGTGAKIFAIEQSTELMALAKVNLAGQDNVSLVDAPLCAGDAHNAPYSLILIDGAIEALPHIIMHQIEEGGRIVTGLAEGAVRRLAVGYKRGASLTLRAFVDTEIAMLPGFAPAKEFVF